MNRKIANYIHLLFSGALKGLVDVELDLTREDLLQLYLLKLEEEANYFKASSPTVEDELFCTCPKCQVSFWFLFSLCCQILTTERHNFSNNFPHFVW